MELTELNTERETSLFLENQTGESIFKNFILTSKKRDIPADIIQTFLDKIGKEGLLAIPHGGWGSPLEYALLRSKDIPENIMLALINKVSKEGLLSKPSSSFLLSFLLASPAQTAISLRERISIPIATRQMIVDKIGNDELVHKYPLSTFVYDISTYVFDRINSFWNGQSRGRILSYQRCLSDDSFRCVQFPDTDRDKRLKMFFWSSPKKESI